MPVEADFCLITFTLLPSPFLNATSLALRNAAKWTYAREGSDNQAGATTFVAPRLARSNAWYINGQGSRDLDVTDNIYIGARPGHNQQARRREEHPYCTPTCTHARTCTCAHDDVTST